MMKAYWIAIVILCINGVAMMLNNTGVFPEAQFEENSELLNQYKQNVDQKTGNPFSDDTTQEITEIKGSISDFLGLKNTVFSIKSTLSKFGVPSVDYEDANGKVHFSMATIIEYIVYLIWVIGLIQFIRGISIKDLV